MLTKPPRIVSPQITDRWWTVEHVRVYLSLPSTEAARKWMYRRGVRRTPSDRRLTCQAWIDKAIQASPRKLSVSQPNQP